MPILDVDLVLRPGEMLSSDLAAQLAEAAAQVFGAPSGSTWVKLRVLQPAEYAENGGQAEGIYPVFVSVLKARVPAPSKLRAEIARLTKAIAQVCGRPLENVHVIYQPAGAGRVAFGGKLVQTR